MSYGHQGLAPDDQGIGGGDSLRRQEAELSSRAYMDRVRLFVRPLANEARVTLDWALRCLSNGVSPR